MFEERHRKLIRVLSIVGLLCCALPSAVLANDNREGKLVGTWRITLFPESPNPFFSLFVFNVGNTMTERIGVHSISTVSGVWKRTSGRGTFALTSEGFADNDADGVFETRFQGRWTIYLNGDTLTGTFTVDLLNLDGTPMGRPPAVQNAPFVGTRMVVLPE